MTARPRWLFPLIAVGLVAAACGGTASSTASSGEPQEAAAPTAEAADANDGATSDQEEAVVESDEATDPAPTPTAPAVETSENVVMANELPACGTVATGTTSYQLEGGGAVHDVDVFVPSSFEPDGRLPVVLNWHGLGSEGPEQAGFTAYEALAEAEGFIVVHPTGIPSEGDGRNSWELMQLDGPERDDLAFANALIDDVVASWCGDPRRVYSTGMSNGGLFTSRLVCELSHRLAAAASVAGVTHPDECTPARAVPFIAIHGTADDVVPFDGTVTTSALADPSDPLSVEFFSQVMPDEFAEFAADMGCATEPERSTLADDVIVYDYLGCDDAVPLTFYEVTDGGHTWPGTPFADLVADQLGYTTNTISATADAWAFFEQHQLPPGPTWQQVPGGPDCMCSDGADWSFWVREADPTKVVMYFQGGGACFDATTCNPETGTYKAATGSYDNPTGAGGIFDFENPANPFRDWSFVAVPYCTGDVHIGDNTQDYGDGLVIEHKGYVNGRYALDDLAARFPDATDVVVTGSSAGGVPAPLFAGLISDETSATNIVALADGSGAYADVPQVNAAIGALWGAFANVPDWPVNADLGPGDWSIPGLFVQAGLHDPSIAMARHDHAFDATQESFAVAAGIMGDDLLSLIDDNAAAIEAQGVPVATYVAPGTTHTILGSEEFYTQAVDDVVVSDWVGDLAEGQPVADVHCTDCG